MRYLCLLVGLLCLACDTAAPVTPTPIAPLSFTGTGNTDTARFTLLVGGDYTVQWTAGGDACQFGAVLAGGDAIPPRQIGFLDTANPQRWNSLAAGSYYWIVSSRCPWTLLMEPAH
jgi:hypothetical protein